jgi:hypothetical protein
MVHGASPCFTLANQTSDFQPMEDRIHLREVRNPSYAVMGVHSFFQLLHSPQMPLEDRDTIRISLGNLNLSNEQAHRPLVDKSLIIEH